MRAGSSNLTGGRPTGSTLPQGADEIRVAPPRGRARDKGREGTPGVCQVQVGSARREMAAADRRAMSDFATLRDGYLMVRAMPAACARAIPLPPPELVN